MALHEDRKYQTLCPEHGWGVSVDEDGCCGGCGNGAYGLGVDEVAAELTRLRAIVKAGEELAKALNEYLPYKNEMHGNSLIWNKWKAVEDALRAFEAAQKGGE